jgi:signal transduction histidine kinase
MQAERRWSLARTIRGIGAARYGLAALLLLVALVTGLGALGALIEARHLQQVSWDQGLALADALETSARNAILANQRLEEAMAQRLLDNARLLDRLLAHEPLSNRVLAELATRQRLHRVEVLDPQGEVLAASAIPMPAPMQEHMAQHGIHGMPPMMRHFYTPLLQGQAQQVLEGFGEQRFWLGRQYGVAIRRQEGTGIIAITANADEILKLRQEMGLQRLLDDLATNPILAYVILYDPALTVVAHTPSGLLAAPDEEPLLRQALTVPGARLQEVAAADGAPVLEVVKPFRLGETTLGLLRIGLQTTHIRALWRRSLLFLSASGLGILVLGGMGLAALFRAQARHHERVHVLERRLTRQERLAALGHLAAGVAHEVRNPLNAIGMGVQRLEREYAPAHAAEEFHTLCRIIRGEVARLNTIVQEFLTLARTPTLQRAPIAVATLLQEVTSLIEAEAQARAVRLTIQVSESLPPLFLDRQHMQQALLNLLLNALQATPPGGAVQVTAEAGAAEVCITITDQGSGIAPERLERIFDPYFTTKPEGTGLGLPIALQIIQAHGGTLDVRSILGQGTTVDVRLPSGPPDEGLGHHRNAPGGITVQRGGVGPRTSAGQEDARGVARRAPQRAEVGL